MDIMVDNFWTENSINLVIIVGAVIAFIICMWIYGPNETRDGVSWKEALHKIKKEKDDGPNDNR